MKPIENTVRYEPVRLLAEGGMGQVWEAVAIGADGFEKTVALKTIRVDFAADPGFVEMFTGEAKLVANLVHQHIVQVYQLGRTEEGYYIAMEYVEGPTLADFIDKHLERKLELPIELGAYILSRVLRALEYAHTKKGRDGKPLGVVHRDVSPRNVFLSWDGVVKLGDFGIAKAARYMRDQEGELLLGKVEYMSPEQAGFGRTDGRSDIFSAGIVLAEALTGRRIFAETDTERALANVRAGEILPLRELRSVVPEALERIAARALERDLAARYGTAGEMALALERYLYGDRFGPTLVTLANYLAGFYDVERPGGLDAAREGTTCRGLRPLADHGERPVC